MRLTSVFAALALLAACSQPPEQHAPAPVPEQEQTAPAPPGPTPEVTEQEPEPVPLPVPRSSNFERSLANVLVSEGGNDDDPVDRGGRTSRGVIQREWNAWRKTHGAPGRGELPADVWKAPQDQIGAIYREKYWDALRAEYLCRGLDYTIFDYGVHSGVSRGGKVLRRQVGLPVTDWHVTDAVVAKVKTRDCAKLIAAVNTERRRFLTNLAVGSQSKYRKGWLARVASVNRISLLMASTAAPLFDLPDDPSYGPGKAYQ